MLALYEVSRREEIAQERDDADQIEIDKIAAKHRERLTDLAKVGDKATVEAIDLAIGDAFDKGLLAKWITSAAAGENAFGDFVHDVIADKAYALACCEYEGEVADAAHDAAADRHLELLHLSALGG